MFIKKQRCNNAAVHGTWAMKGPYFQHVLSSSCLIATYHLIRTTNSFHCQFNISTCMEDVVVPIGCQLSPFKQLMLPSGYNSVLHKNCKTP